MSKKDEVLKLLEEKGLEGATSREIYERTGSFRYGALIDLLRKDGLQIKTVHVKGSLYKYVLDDDEARLENAKRSIEQFAEPKAVSWINE